jgi:hypothetical protein
METVEVKHHSSGDGRKRMGRERLTGADSNDIKHLLWR